MMFNIGDRVVIADGGSPSVKAVLRDVIGQTGTVVSVEKKDKNYPYRVMFDALNPSSSEYPRGRWYHMGEEELQAVTQ